MSMIVDIYKLVEIILDLMTNAEYYQANDLIKTKLDELDARIKIIEQQVKGK